MRSGSLLSARLLILKSVLYSSITWVADDFESDPWETSASGFKDRMEILPSLQLTSNVKQNEDWQLSREQILYSEGKKERILELISWPTNNSYEERESLVVEGDHNGFFSRWGSKPEDLGSLQSKSGTSIIIYMVILWAAALESVYDPYLFKGGYSYDV